MASVHKVLIVGGGMVGNSLAVMLDRAGVEVDLVEIDPGWSALGSGITLMGNALRVLREVGVWPQVAANIATSPSFFPGRPGLGGPDVPALGGMYRPKLQQILSEAVRAGKTRVRLGVTVDELKQRDEHVWAHFTDRTSDHYDLVVGADGIHSGLRPMIGFEEAPRKTGLAIWRIYTRRPASVTMMETRFDGPCYMAGINPTGDNHLYAFLVVDEHGGEPPPRAELPARLRELTDGYGGTWAEIGDSIDNPDLLDYRSFGYLLLDPPWNRGRAVLIGDAAHGCPPTIGQGAAMGLEDAWVLAELLTGSDTLDQALFDRFMARRYPRVRTVVDASVAICDALREPDGAATVDRLFKQTLRSLYQPV
jgi:2-polyprenyl-6-methoxyphenol hydroxylase-like FAD-dependent oxidoreductase